MRVAVVCGAYAPRNLPLQPWRYVSEIAKGLAELGHGVTVITDQAGEDAPHVRRVASVRLPRRGNPALETELERFEPEVCLWHLGLTSALHFEPSRLHWPTYGLFTSPVYRPRQLLALGARRIYRARDYAAIHLLGAGIPRARVRKMLEPLTGVLVESRHNALALAATGLPNEKIHHLPPGIDGHFREPLPAAPVGGPFTVLYMGSPLPVRGVFDLLDALALARRRHRDLRLRILARGRGEYAGYEGRLHRHIARLGLADHATVRSGFLERTELREELTRAHMVALPFQIVPSDVPVAVLENMALGRPVLATDVDGIPEYLSSGRGYIARPGNPRALADEIEKAAADPAEHQRVARRALAYARSIPNWRQVAVRAARLIGAEASVPV